MNLGEGKRCSICVATYRRPALLGRLLESLLRQELPDGVDIEIIVVDNDPDRTADPIVSRLRSRYGDRLCYLHEPRKNISLARNLAVRHASGEYIAFLDDDQLASRQWLGNLCKTIETFGGDGVFGPVRAEFDLDAPGWTRRTDFYFTPVLATGQQATFTRTGNCLLRAQVLKTLVEPFDPAYGLTGGEDSHLFDRLERMGARFIYCREAWVSEYVPPSRTRLSYLFLLGLKGGNTHTRRTIAAAQYRILIRAFMVGKALLFGATSLALMVMLLPSPALRARWLMKLGSNLGRLMAAFGWHYQAYR